MRCANILHVHLSTSHKRPRLDFGRDSYVEGTIFFQSLGQYMLNNITQFMAWERSFEARVLKIRGRELKNQHLVYIIEV